MAFELQIQMLECYKAERGGVTSTNRAPDRARPFMEAAMAVKPLPDSAYLRQLLDYDPDTGVLKWKARPVDEQATDPSVVVRWNTRWAGKEALASVNNNGYRAGTINARPYLAHRLIWKMVYGTDPVAQIDHINGVRTDNRIANLRAATPAQNSGNMRPKSKQPYKGVTLRESGRWGAYISGGNGRQRQLGTHDTAEQAAMAYDAAARVRFGDFACLNFPEGK